MLRSFVIPLATIILAGCAAQSTVPQGYSGPIATVWDNILTEDATKAQIFAVVQIDGRRVDNSFVATANASSGQVFRLIPMMIDRKVPAVPMKVTLRASHATGAPIQALFSSASRTFYSVEGVVDFSPLPNKIYVVRGELKQVGSAVWIEDNETMLPVTEKIVKK